MNALCFVNTVIINVSLKMYFTNSLKILIVFTFHSFP